MNSIDSISNDKNHTVLRKVIHIPNVDIVKVDMDIGPYDWDINGKTGRTAYLQAIKVTQEVDRFCQQYAEEEYPEEF